MTLPIANTEVREALEEAARVSGMDVNYLYAVAKQESGLNPNIKAATSSATGLFQFISSTWNEMVTKYGSTYNIKLTDIRNPRANAIMGALFMRDNFKYLIRATGKKPDLADLYLAHFSGVGTAAKAMNAPVGASPSTVWSAAAIRANPGIFKKGLNVQQVIQVIANKVLRYYKEVA